jgi:hypothetical protein
MIAAFSYCLSTTRWKKGWRKRRLKWEKESFAPGSDELLLHLSQPPGQTKERKLIPTARPRKSGKRSHT